jgi:hypothetical protein
MKTNALLAFLLTKSRHWYTSWDRRNQSTHSHFTHLRWHLKCHPPVHSSICVPSLEAFSLNFISIYSDPLRATCHAFSSAFSSSPSYMVKRANYGALLYADFSTLLFTSSLLCPNILLAPCSYNVLKQVKLYILIILFLGFLLGHGRWKILMW